MLKQLKTFNEKISELMLPCIHNRIILYGYTYSGRFLKWYAEYYHGIKVDYIIYENMANTMPYDYGYFYQTFFEFDYKDTKDAIIWMARPMNDGLTDYLKTKGFEVGKNIVYFHEAIYGDDLYWPENTSDNPYERHKTGNRDVQSIEYLEWKYGCNFVTAISREELEDEMAYGAPYNTFTENEVFSILDRCHVHPTEKDGIFDFGCGKGGAMVNCAHYGFKKIGGVEFDGGLYKTLVDNMQKLGMEKDYEVECIHRDARDITTALDKYNYFYFFDPFNAEIYDVVLKNIKDSVDRCPRKIRVLCIYPKRHEVFNKLGYTLYSQFEITTRQRVVNIYELGKSL